MSLTIIEALADPALFGALPAFHDLKSWRAWMVFLAAVYGLPLSALASVGVSEAEALAIFCKHTGRTTYDPPPGGYAETACIVGVQSGKSRCAGVIASYEAMMATPEPDGTDLYCILVAQDQRSSLRTLFSYAKAPFDRVPVLARSVVSRRADVLQLDGCTLAVYPCRPQAVRGLRARVVVCDELAFYRSSEGYPTDVEMLRVARGRVATTGGKLIILSSPYGQSGALYELHRKHFGHDDASVLVWQASAPEMNPTLPADYLARMEQDDPEAYQSEVLGQFRAGVSTFFDPEAINTRVDEGIRERPPISGVTYQGYVDAASGSGKDSFAFGIAHQDSGVAVLDVVRAWKPPFNPSSPIAESAELCVRYGIREVQGDRYAPGFVSEGYRSHHITYIASERDTSATYLELLPLVNAGQVRLLDLPELLRELRGLERRRGASGRDRVDHRHGSHDDMAVACAGALVSVAPRSTPGIQVINCFTGELISGDDADGVHFYQGQRMPQTITVDEWKLRDARIRAEKLMPRPTTPDVNADLHLRAPPPIDPPARAPATIWVELLARPGAGFVAISEADFNPLEHRRVA